MAIARRAAGEALPEPLVLGGPATTGPLGWKSVIERPPSIIHLFFASEIRQHIALPSSKRGPNQSARGQPCSNLLRVATYPLTCRTVWQALSVRPLHCACIQTLNVRKSLAYPTGFREMYELETVYCVKPRPSKSGCL